MLAAAPLAGPMLVAASSTAAAEPGAVVAYDALQSAVWWDGLRQLAASNAQQLLAVQACDGAVAAAWAALAAAVPAGALPAGGARASQDVAAASAPAAAPAGAGEDPPDVAAPAGGVSAPVALPLDVPAPAAALPPGHPVVPGGAAPPAGGAVPPLPAGAVGVQPGAAPVLLRGQVVEHVDHFVYLGSVVTADNSLDRDVSRRLSRAAYAFQTLQPVLRNRHLSARTKCTLYRAIVVNNLVYDSEAWVPQASQLCAASTSSICAACGISWVSAGWAV